MCWERRGHGTGDVRSTESPGLKTRDKVVVGYVSKHFTKIRVEQTKGRESLV